jgi:flagellin
MTISFNIGNARAASLGGLATLSGIRNNISTALNGVIINGTAVYNSVAADDTLSSGGNSYSAIAISKRINEVSGQTKVYADIQTSIVRVNNMDFAAYTGGDLSVDKFAVNDVSILGTGINNVNSFIGAVNNYSNQTGVKARLQSGSTNSIEFYADDGRNIELYWSAQLSASGLHNVFANSANFGGFSTGTVFSTGTTSANLFGGYTAGLVRTGAIKLRSSAAISITNMSSAALGFGTPGATTLAISVDSSQGLGAISLLTQDVASDALSVVDATLTSLNTLRSGLGATQSRLDSVINNLGVTLENISGARSQIRDTDVAVETAELTRAQILQEAGVAVLGQANASSQAALRLLQNI